MTPQVFGDVLDASLVEVVVGPDATPDEWHAARRTGLGGSDAAVIAGLSPWKSPLGLWLEKRGEGAQFEGNRFTDWGTRLEPLVAAAYAQDTGRTVLDPQCTVRSRQRPFLLATPDRLVIDDTEVGGLEVKTTSAYAAEHWDGGVPDYHELQCQHYMAVTGLTWWDVSVLIGGNEYRSYRLHRDERVIASLIRLEERFWTDHVEAGVAPPVTAASPDLRFIPAKPGHTVTLPAEAETLLDQRRHAHAEATRWVDQKAELDDRIRALMLDAEEAYLPGDDETPAVTWKATRPRLVFDTEAFAADHPHLHDQYTTTRPGSRRLLVKKGPKS